MGDENQDLGYNHMFADMFTAYENGKEASETFYDGYIVNAIMDAAYESVKSKKWEAVNLPAWRGPDPEIKSSPVLEDYDDQYYLIKEELLPDGSRKTILKDKVTGQIIQK